MSSYRKNFENKGKKMVEPAKQLLFHGVIVMLFALGAGFPYAKAIVKKKKEDTVRAWRVAHSALAMGAILMFSLVPILSQLQVSIDIMWTISILFIICGYAFILALILGPLVGYRGLTTKGPLSAKLVYAGNSIGALTSLLGIIVLLYAAWRTL